MSSIYPKTEVNTFNAEVCTLNVLVGNDPCASTVSFIYWDATMNSGHRCQAPQIGIRLFLIHFMQKTQIVSDYLSILNAFVLPLCPKLSPPLSDQLIFSQGESGYNLTNSYFITIDWIYIHFQSICSSVNFYVIVLIKIMTHFLSE